MTQPINMVPHLFREAGPNYSVGLLRHTLPIFNEYAIGMGKTMVERDREIGGVLGSE